MTTCSPSSSLDVPSSQTDRVVSSSGSAFAPFQQQLLMQQQLFALLSAQLQSSLPIPSATTSIGQTIKSEPSLDEDMDTSTLLECSPPAVSSTSLLMPSTTLLTTKMNQSLLSTVAEPLSIIKEERRSRLPSESPSSTVSSPRKRIADIDKTSDDYLERRRKNNDSARRSREVRRLREQANRDRMQELEVENGQLRVQITSMRMELSQLQLVLLSGGVNLPAIASQANSDSSTSPSQSDSS